MRVFLTGATGHVGSALLDAFVRAGFSLTALVRSPDVAERLLARGVTPQLGNLASSATYAPTAESCDVIVHAGYEQSKRGPEIDKNAINVLMAAASRRVARGLPTSMIYTSVMWVLGDTSAPADETAHVRPTPYVAWRTEHERLVLDLAQIGGVRASIVRPGLLYGRPRGIIGDLLRDASNGLVRVVGDGSNHWPCVYDRDLADLYVRLVADSQAAGIFHATDEADECVGDIVDAIARHLPVRPDVRHVPLEEARAKFGLYADALALDQIVRSGRARALGWAPTLHSVAGNAARLIEEFRTARDAAA